MHKYDTAVLDRRIARLEMEEDMDAPAIVKNHEVQLILKEAIKMNEKANGKELTKEFLENYLKGESD